MHYSNTIQMQLNSYTKLQTELHLHGSLNFALVTISVNFMVKKQEKHVVVQTSLHTQQQLSLNLTSE